MGREDFEEEDAAERARFMKRKAGTFDRGLFERLAPQDGAQMGGRTFAVACGYEPAATSAWCSLWIAHARHPVWTARALVLLMSVDGWDSHPVAVAMVAAFDRMMTFRKSTVQPWWGLVALGVLQ